MVRTLGLVGIIILLSFAWYYNKKKAQKRCTELLYQVKNNPETFDQTVHMIVNERLLKSPSDFIRANEKCYLIEKSPSLLTVHSLNNSKQQTILESQYQRLERRLNQKNPTYICFIESCSVFFRLPPPFENNILRIDM